MVAGIPTTLLPNLQLTIAEDTVANLRRHGSLSKIRLAGATSRPDGRMAVFGRCKPPWFARHASRRRGGDGRKVSPCRRDLGRGVGGVERCGERRCGVERLEGREGTRRGWLEVVFLDNAVPRNCEAQSVVWVMLDWVGVF